MSIGKRILVVSSANMDFVMRLKSVPAPGQTMMENTGTYNYVPGGKGGNSALAFARLGGDCVFCAKIGNDQNGQTLRALYKSAGIDTRFVTADATAKTGLAAIMVEDSGQNRIVVYPGANSSVTDDDIENAFLCCPDALFMQLEISEEAILSAAKYANEKNIPIFIDAGPARAGFPLDKLGHVEVFSPNETETRIFTGIAPDTMDNCLRAVIKLRTMVDARYIVLKLGSRGAYVYDGKYCSMAATYDGPVVDTTAAGDAFSAAITLRYLECGDILKAAKYANAVGTITVGRPGASSSIPTSAEVDAFISARNIDA